LKSVTSFIINVSEKPTASVGVNLKMEIAGLGEILVTTHNQEDYNIKFHRHGNVTTLDLVAFTIC
jgi:hypothetical protein